MSSLNREKYEGGGASFASYWLIHGELVESDLSEDDFFIQTGRCTSRTVDVLAEPNPKSVFLRRRRRMAPTIVLSTEPSRTRRWFPLLLDGQQCSLNSIMAFITALAVWAQDRHDNKKLLGLTLTRSTIQELTVQYLEPEK